MTHKFLRDDGWFQPIGPADITTTATATTTGFLTYVTASITTTASIAFTTSAYTDAVTVNAGSTGVWFVTGNVCMQASGAGTIIGRIWDGTTVINTFDMATPAGGSNIATSLSGVITNPTSSLRISAQGLTGGALTYVFVPKDISTGTAANNLTITAIRIG